MEWTWYAATIRSTCNNPGMVKMLKIFKKVNDIVSFLFDDNHILLRDDNHETKFIFVPRNKYLLPSTKA